MAKERSLLSKFLTEYTRMGSRLFRCQSGLFWAGKSTRFSTDDHVSVKKGDVLIRNARRVKAGEVGMSDLIGFTRVKITKDLVGKEIAVFTAIEAKSARVQVTKEQSTFIRMVNNMGGIATVAHEFNDVLAANNKFLNGGQDEQDRH